MRLVLWLQLPTRAASQRERAQPGEGPLGDLGRVRTCWPGSSLLRRNFPVRLRRDGARGLAVLGLLPSEARSPALKHLSVKRSKGGPKSVIWSPLCIFFFGLLRGETSNGDEVAQQGGSRQPGPAAAPEIGMGNRDGRAWNQLLASPRAG